MEYSKSIIDFEDSGSIGGINKNLEVTSLLWNDSIARESGDVDEKLGKDLLEMIQPFWQVEQSEARLNDLTTNQICHKLSITYDKYLAIRKMTLAKFKEAFA